MNTNLYFSLFRSAVIQLHLLVFAIFLFFDTVVTLETVFEWVLSFFFDTFIGLVRNKVPFGSESAQVYIEVCLYDAPNANANPQPRYVHASNEAKNEC